MLEEQELIAPAIVLGPLLAGGSRIINPLSWASESAAVL